MQKEVRKKSFSPFLANCAARPEQSCSPSFPLLSQTLGTVCVSVCVFLCVCLCSREQAEKAAGALVRCGLFLIYLLY